MSPPKAGKTTIIKQIVYSIERNSPETHVMVLLVDERPEEVTDMRRHVLRAEVVASTFDRPSDEHCHVAELAIERARRLVEMGKDVVIILDGITRLARAYNLAAPASGRIMSGGVDSSALYPPKKFFGSARNVEEGGSLTILATALIDTGSKMDEVIFEEFKGTGNMELRLDRRVADRRIYPAIDVEQSSTRHEELLFDRNDLQQVWKLRRVLNALEGGAGLELLIDKLRHTKTNAEFLSEIAKAPAGMAIGASLADGNQRLTAESVALNADRVGTLPPVTTGALMKTEIHPEYVVVPSPLLVRQRVHDALHRVVVAASSSARSATPSTRASRSWLTPVDASSASSAGTRRRSRPPRSRPRRRRNGSHERTSSSGRAPLHGRPGRARRRDDARRLHVGDRGAQARR